MSPLTAPPTHFDIQLAKEPILPAERAKRMQNLGFGKVFTEYMVVIPYSEETGWGRGASSRTAHQLDPAASVLHYGQAIFEGFKAYRQPDGHIKTFRPEANANRFNASARRLAMPELPVELFVEAADTLIRQERDWVPAAVGESLYLRPFMIATEAALGVKPSHEYLFLLIASPSGAYFPQGVKPVTVWISENYVPGRARRHRLRQVRRQLRRQPHRPEGGLGRGLRPGGLAGRRAPPLRGGDGRHEHLLRLPGGGADGGGHPRAHRHPAAGHHPPHPAGTGQGMGFKAEERRISVEEWQGALQEGRMTEAFACGTAAVITPIGTVKSPTASG